MGQPDTGEADIFILGTGIRSGDDITRQTIDTLARCREVLYVDPAIGTKALLQEYCPKVTSLFEQSYGAGMPRLSGYRHMAVRVVEAALANPPVAFAIHGHPLVLCTAPFLIQSMAAALGLRVKTLPGISALDHLFADLQLDPGRGGLLMYEATDLLLHRRPLVPEVPTLLWQIGNIETRLHSNRPSRPQRLQRLRNYLETAYPSEHQLTAYYASPHALARPELATFPLWELTVHAASLHAGITVYLPPCRPQAVADRQLMHDMDDPAHLARITE